MSSSRRSIDSGEEEEEEDLIPLAQLLTKKRRIQKEEDLRQVVKKGCYPNNPKNITLPLPASSYEGPVLQLENGSKSTQEGRCRSTKNNTNIVQNLLNRSMYSSSQKNFICNTNRFRAFFFIFNSLQGDNTSSSRRRTTVPLVLDPSNTDGNTTKKNIIACLSFHTYGTHVAVGCTEGTLRIYECKPFLSLLYQVQLKKKPITNIQWNSDNLQEIAAAFAHCPATDNIILFNVELQIATPLVTNNNDANTNGYHHSHRSTITYNTLLFLPSNTTSTVSTATQLVAGSTTGTLCVWSYRCYPSTTGQQQQPTLNASPSTWKQIYNKCTILPRGEAIIDMKHITEGIIVIGGRLGSVVLLDLWKSQLPIFSSTQKVPTFLQQIRVPNQQQPLQRLWTHLTDSPNNTTSSSSSRSRSMDAVSFLERITIWTMSFHGTITRIVFQLKGNNNTTSRCISSSNLKNNNDNMPSSCYYEPSFTSFTTATTILPKNDHQTTTTKQTVLTTCLGDLLLLHNPFMCLALLGQQEEEELTKTTTQNSVNRWDPRVLSVPTQENINNNNSRYSIKIVLLDPQQQSHYGILPLYQEPCQIVVHPTNHSYVVVAYSNGSVELLSI
jgi:hypothetical protein